MKQLHSAILTAYLFAASSLSGQEVPPFVGAHGATAPATYNGSGEDGDWHLDLWPDQAFHLSRNMQDSGTKQDVAGRWSADGRNLLLDLGNDTLRLAVQNSERLRPEGAPDDTSSDLVRASAFDPASISLPVAGMFTYYADAPSFVHCATGHTYPVVQEGPYLDLERAYLEDRPGPAEPLFVTLDATITTRQQMEGPDRLSLVVEAFHGTWAGEDCKRASAAPDLIGTVWHIRSLGDEMLEWSPPAREPFLVFDAATGVFNASVGCNTMRGGFSVADGGLSFGSAASTMMACPDALADAEAKLIDALEKTAGYLVGGRTLRLVDDAGAVRADLEAVYLP